MSKKKFIQYEQVSTVVNHDSGEITHEHSFSTAVVEREPEYVKLYLADIIRLKDLPKNSDRVLLVLLRNMTYRNMIATYMPMKKIISKELGMGIESVSKAIKNLKKAGVLISFDRGIYMADPELFGKGKWQDIKKLRLIVEYSEEGKTISGERAAEHQLKLELA